MKNVKRRLALLLSASMIVTLFAGCSSSTGEAKDDGTNSKSAEEKKDNSGSSASGKTVVNFWHSFNSHNGEVLDQLIKNFNDTHDNIEVVGTYQGGYNDASAKAQTALSSGEAPDIMMLSADACGIFANEDVLADLTPYMKDSGVDENDFVQGFVWDSKVNGKFISIPFGRSTPVLYVNKDILKEAGVEVPKTWDEVKEVTDKLVQKNGDEITRYGIAMPYDTWYFFMAVGQAGGSILNADKTGVGCIDDGTAKEAFTFLHDLKMSGGLYFGPTTDSEPTCKQLFYDGKAAMLMTSIGGLNTVNENAKFDYDVAFIPYGKKQVIPTGGNNLVMFDNSENKDAAWEFLKWCIQDPNGGAYLVANTGYLPTTKTMAESDPIKEVWKNNPRAKVAYEQLQYASDDYYRYPQTDKIINEFFTAIQAIMYDDEDIDQQLKIFGDSVNDIMKE